MRRQNTQLLKDVLQDIVRTEGLEPKLQEARLLVHWDELLGQTVARATHNKYIRDRKLFVQLRSSIVRQQLFMIRNEIMEKLNQHVGVKMIDEIVLI